MLFCLRDGRERLCCGCGCDDNISNQFQPPHLLASTVKLYNQGLESIQVSDNGTGVPKSSRPLMAMKHATSKLREFDDLYSDGNNRNEERGDNGEDENNNNQDLAFAAAPTLGFRGEALFCLANVSRSLTVSTRSSDDDTNTTTSSSNGLGEQFAFNHEGELISTSVQRLPRGMGTTVVVEGLFETLPVRRVDLCKRIKGQRMKLLRVLQGCECCGGCGC